MSQQSEEIEIKMCHKNPNMVHSVFIFFHSIIPEHTFEKSLKKGGFEEDNGQTPHVQARVLLFVKHPKNSFELGAAKRCM